MAGGRLWTEEERAVLLASLAAAVDPVKVARKLERTVKACEIEAARLDALRGRRGWSSDEAAVLLGLNRVTVSRYVRLGLIGTYVYGTFHIANKTGRRWADIPVEAVEAFVRERPFHYNADKLDVCLKPFIPVWRGEWVPLRQAVAECHYVIQWFYERIWDGRLRATKGTLASGSRTWLHRPSLEAVLRGQAGTLILAAALSYQKAKGRGFHTAATLEMAQVVGKRERRPKRA